MEIKYFCENKKCKIGDQKPFVKVLEMDAIMDEKNVADLFCPHCKQPLQKKETAEVVS